MTGYMDSVFRSDDEDMEIDFNELQNLSFNQRESISYLYNVIINLPKRLKIDNHLKLANERNSLKKRIMFSESVCQRIIDFYDSAKRFPRMDVVRLVEKKVCDLYSNVLKGNSIDSELV